MATGVPEGRDQVLAASHFYTGEAEKWWEKILGQPIGKSLASFRDLIRVIDKYFILQDAEKKAMAALEVVEADRHNRGLYEDSG